MNTIFVGCVENRIDPMKLGRCQVRVVGVHTHDKSILPTEDLPWAYPIQPITSAAISGIGQTPLGLVEGTWVVLMFRDEEQQQPIILGSIGGIPQEEYFGIDEEEDDQITLDSKPEGYSVNSSGEAVPSGQGYLRDSSGNVVTDGSGNPIRTGEPQYQENTSYSRDKSVGQAPGPQAQPGIAALNSAMDRLNFTGKYGRAAILAIVGGESNWVPKSEGFNYSAEALKVVFPRTFANDDALAKRYARWKGSRESFFNFVYAPENNGASLGNTREGDGGRFYGRGFIQLTGRSNYAEAARLSGIDVLNNPELLNLDIDVSAEVTVRYFTSRITVDPSDPSYFMAALRAVGGARSGWSKKESYYAYFLGESPPPAQTDKSAKPDDHVQESEISPYGLPSDRQKNIVMGFNDPNMKYPLRQYIGEPDTNRLARGRIDGTIVEYKDQKRLDSVATANGFTWSQPDIPFNAKYPYNKVTESESGHVIEIDDTPDNERMHFYHRKGTYTEVDPNGTQVNRIVGDGYEIIDRNGYVYIAGECNITVSGVARVLCQNDAFIDVEGESKINLASNADLNVASNFNVNVGGEFRLKADNIKMESNSDFNLRVGGSNKQTSSGSFELNASGRANIEGSTIHLAEGAASASSSGLGAPIAGGTKSTQTFSQLKPPPRNLESEIEYETPEENETEEAKQFHEERKTSNVSDEASLIESAEKPENTATEVRGSCSVIYSLQSIPDSFVLHTDSTGYKWTVGALSRGNKISPLQWKGKNTSVQDIVCNMKGLCENILAPLNETIGRVGSAWTITSAYRNNVPSGGSATSQHLIGCAIDFVCGSNSFAYKLNYDCVLKIAQVMPYDQLILEYRDPGVNGNRNAKRINWIHVSYNNVGGGRRQALTFLNDKTYSTNFSYLG